MNDSCFSLRRSPRKHAGTLHPFQPIRQSSLVQYSSAVDQQNVSSEPHLAGLSPADIDRSALLNTCTPHDRFPAVPPPLSAVATLDNDSDEDILNTDAGHTVTGQTPASHIGSTQSPSAHAENTPTSTTYAGTTQPPSTHAGTTQPPSTYAGTTQPPSTYAGTTQPPSTQPPPTYAGTMQPPSTSAETAQTPNLAATVSPFPSTGGVVSEQNDDASLVAREEGQDETRDAAKSKELFIHLNRLTVRQQKAVATAFGIVHAGNKKVRAARVYVILSGIMERKGKSAEEILEAKSLEVGIDLVAEFRRTLDIWCDDHEETEIPPMSELGKLAGARLHPRATGQITADSVVPEGSDGDGVGNNSTRDNVSLEEFARLMLIFRDVPEASADLRRSGQDLTRQELDLHTSRNAFWHNRIEPLFNSPENLFTEAFDGELQDIDPGRPVTTFRTGTCLQNMSNNFRKEFTKIYKYWSVSGNLELSSFKNFCYIPKTQVLSRAGLRFLIAFRIFRLGTPHQNDLILEFGTKETAAASNAGLESGLIQNTASEAGSKRRRSSSQELSSAFVNALNTFSTDTRSAKDTNGYKKRKEELETLAVQGAKLENNRRRIDSMATVIRYTKEIEPNERPDPRILGIFRTYCGRLADEMEDVLGNQTNSGL